MMRTLLSMSTTTSSSTNSQYVSLAEKLPELPEHAQRIFLIRHGETDWNNLGLMQGGGFDLELNDSGKEQARRVAQELKNIPFGVIASSHLQRAQGTADAIASFHPTADRITQRGFGEMRFGNFEGLALRGPDCTKETTQRFQKVNDQMKQDKSVSWPGGGESIGEVETRARLALDAVLAHHHPYNCVVAHGRTNNVLLANLLRDDGLYFYKYRQGNCCINVVDLLDGVYTDHFIRYEEHMEQ